MNLHQEHHFETDICNHLASAGWLYAPPGSEDEALGYDTPARPLPRRSADLGAGHAAPGLGTLAKNHGAVAEAMLLESLRKVLGERRL